jgi:hypothetical protein
MPSCEGENQFRNTLNQIDQTLNDCCGCNNIKDEAKIEQDTIKKEKYVPRPNCRVHFSGLLMGGQAVELNISKIYKKDNCSEYVGEGEYPSNERAFPNAVATTFDGIAIDSGTRLIIYSGKNYRGNVLLDVTGPKIINNMIWKNDSRYNHCNTDRFPRDLEANYPRSVRIWSSGNMHDWSYGSCKIICAQ